MAETTDYVEPRPFIDAWLKDYIGNHAEKLAEPLDKDLFKRLDATRIPEDFVDIIKAYISHVQTLDDTKIKVWHTESLVFRYAANRINEMMKSDNDADTNNYKNIIASTRKIRKKISRVAKEKADLISVVGESRKTFHVDNVTHGMYVDIAETLGVSVVGVVKFALHIIFNESVWINKEYDFMELTYFVDWDNRSCKIIKDRMETRLREVERAIEQIYDRYLSSKNRYINGETIDIERMKNDIKWLNAIKKEGMLANDIDDFELIVHKRELMESGHGETEAHKIALDDKHNSSMKSFMDMVTVSHKLIKLQDNKIDELCKSHNQANQVLQATKSSYANDMLQVNKLLQANQALCDSCNVKIEALNEQLDTVKHEKIILKTDMQKMNEKLELLSESGFNRIKKLVFK